MASTGKDHARMNLGIWGDDDWLDCTPRAQHLYFVLWNWPTLSYCGAGDWHPGRIASKAKTWTPAAVESAAAELSRDMFLLIDETTGEFLLRSWIKHDGLWKVPNMAVSMANARAELASRALRGVIVHEVSKVRAAHPELSSWARDAVVSMLEQKPVDPASLEPFTAGSNPSSNPPANPWPNPSDNPPPNPPANEKLTHPVNPPSNPGPTHAPAPTPLLKEGSYVGTEGDSAREGEPPSSNCMDHPDGTERPCHPCGEARRRHRAWEESRKRARAEARSVEARAAAQVRADAIAACDLCDESGYVGAALCGHAPAPADRPSLNELFQQAQAQRKSA